MTSTPSTAVSAGLAGHVALGGAGVDDHARGPVSPARLARTAGLLYLVVAVLGAFAQIVRVNVYEPGNAAAMVGLILAATLYRLLAHAGRSIARTMVAFVAVSVAIACLNMVDQLGAVLVATNHSYASAFGGEGSHAVVLRLMDLQHYGYLTAQLTWLWLFALGLLGYRSGMFPKWLSVLLMAGTVCYVSDATTSSVPRPSLTLPQRSSSCRKSCARWRSWRICSSRVSGRSRCARRPDLGRRCLAAG
jgi:hypothetical protein